MGIRRHLTYANVASTLALVLAIGAGGAYAVDKIGSSDVRNDSLRSKDLRDRRAVRGKDVAKNALGGRTIDEASLDAAKLVRASGDSESTCVLSAAFADCVATRVNLPRRGLVIAIATGGFFGDGAGGETSADCEVRIDDGGEALGQTPGEMEPATSTTATDGFARTITFDAVASGAHRVALACAELAPEAVIDTPTITAIAIPGG